MGTLGNGSTIASHVPVEVTCPAGEEPIGITSGGYHTLVLTDANRVYGFGKRTKGQLGSKWTKGSPKFVTAPERVPLPEDLTVDGIFAGSLFSMAMVSEPAQPGDQEP